MLPSGKLTAAGEADSRWRCCSGGNLWWNACNLEPVSSLDLNLTYTTPPQPQDLLSAFHGVLDARRRLEGEDQTRFDGQILNVTCNLQASTQEKKALALIPIGEPDARPKATDRRMKRGAKARIMITSETLNAQQKKESRRQKRAEKDVEIL